MPIAVTAEWPGWPVLRDFPTPSLVLSVLSCLRRYSPPEALILKRRAFNSGHTRGLGPTGKEIGKPSDRPWAAPQLLAALRGLRVFSVVLGGPVATQPPCCLWTWARGPCVTGSNAALFFPCPRQAIHGKNLVAILHLLVSLATHFRAPIRLPEHVSVQVVSVRVSRPGGWWATSVLALRSTAGAGTVAWV